MGRADPCASVHRLEGNDRSSIRRIPGPTATGPLQRSGRRELVEAISPMAPAAVLTG
jgi:hypothetical protein